MKRDAAIAQVVLEGVPLPAEKKRLLDYAREQDPGEGVLRALSALEDRKYRTLDEVGEAIAGVQPAFAPPDVHRPDVESDEVPGGSAYTERNPASGTIREEPEILLYEEQLVREPAPVGEGIPKKGSRGRKPRARKQAGSS